jgi:YegS/Rv2252/BmrU family lipid kinase
MRTAIVFNPRSGRGRSKTELLDRVLERLRRGGYETDVYPTEAPGHAREIAKRAGEAGLDRVVAWGGDGTLNEVAWGLLGTTTALGVLPGGTVNVFAREVGIPRDLEGALDVLVEGEVRRIPVGMANGRPFLLMAGCGIDAEVAFRVKGAFKSTLGALAFWLDGFRMLASYPMTPLRIDSAGKSIVGTAVIVGKTRRYGPRYFITPDAKLDEPKLHVVVFQGGKGRHYLKYLFGVIARAHLGFRDVVHFKTDALTVSAEGSVPYQLDGEPVGHAPLTLGVREGALGLVLPRQPGRK